MKPGGEISPCYTVTFHRERPHPPARIWRAITDPREVTEWMDCPVQIELRVGGAYHVDFGEHGRIDGVIVRVAEQSNLAYVWGVSVVEWHLQPTPRGCAYTFTHHGQPPGLVPDEGGIAAGWEAWLGALDRFVDGLPADRTAEHRMCTRLEPLYREEIEAAIRL